MRAQPKIPCLTNPQPQFVIWKKMVFFLPFFPPWRSSTQPPTTRREEQHLRGIRQPHPFLLLELFRCTFWHIPSLCQPLQQAPRLLWVSHNLTWWLSLTSLPGHFSWAQLDAKFILEGLLCGGGFVTPKPGSSTPVLLVSPISVSRATPPQGGHYRHYPCGVELSGGFGGSPPTCENCCKIFTAKP